MTTHLLDTMEQTTPRRRSPLRDSTYPSASTSAASTSRPFPARAQTEHRPEAHTRHANSRRSILRRILRSPVGDGIEELNSATPAYGNDNLWDDDSDKKRRHSSTSRWDKRASRKAPLPPSRVLPGIEVRQRSRERISRRMDEMSMERNRQEVNIPKVFLFPPEEDEIEPIKLYPLPSPLVARPPLVNLSSANSRPSSVYSANHPSFLSNAGKNTWGGMSEQFGKPPPVFRRGGRRTMSAGGVILPKKREQVAEEREKRMSMFSPEAMDRQVGHYDSAGPSYTSQPRRSTPPNIRRPTSPPVELPLTPEEVPKRTHSTSALTSFHAASPSFVSFTTDTAQSVQTSDREIFYPARQWPEGEFEELVESPVSLTSPALPNAEPLQEAEPQSFDQEDQTPAITDDDDSGVERSDPEPIAIHLTSPLQPNPSRSHTAPTPAASWPISGQLSRPKRRSLSLTSIHVDKPVNAVRPPAIPVGGKTVRKHKSLKNFFFLKDNLAKEVSEPAAELVDDMISGLVKGSEEGAKRGSTFGGMLSRPKSKPTLRVDVKASSAATFLGSLSTPVTGSRMTVSPAPLISSTTVTSPSASSDSIPNTPGLGEEAKSKPQIHNETTVKGPTKRFSLSNMANAFKRTAGRKDASPVSQVTEVFVSLKQDKMGTGPTGKVQPQSNRLVKESVGALSPTSSQYTADLSLANPKPLLSSLESPGFAKITLLSDSQGSSPRTSVHSTAEVSVHGSIHDTASFVSELSSSFELDAELDRAQLMLISPKTRRKPTETLQDVLGIGATGRQSTVVKHDPVLSRRSAEAIVSGPLLLGPGMDSLNEDEEEQRSLQGSMEVLDDRQGDDETMTTMNSSRRPSADSMSTHDGGVNDSQTSLESLSTSSSTCEQHDPLSPITPASLQPGVLLDPLELPIMVSTPSTDDIYVKTVPSNLTPQASFRFFTASGSSPRNSSPRKFCEDVQPSTLETGSEKKLRGITDYPPTPPISQEEHPSLSEDIQLRSLRFDSLGLDFDHLAFPGDTGCRR